MLELKVLLYLDFTFVNQISFLSPVLLENWHTKQSQNLGNPILAFLPCYQKCIYQNRRKKNPQISGKQPIPEFKSICKGASGGNKLCQKICRGQGLRESHCQVTTGEAPWRLGYVCCANNMCVGALLKHPLALHKPACQHYPPPSLRSRIREKLRGSVLPFGSP